MQLSLRRGLRPRCRHGLHSSNPRRRLCTGRSALGSSSALTEGFVETSWFKWAQVCGKHAGDYFRPCVEIYCSRWSPVQAPWQPWLDGWVQFGGTPLVGAFCQIFPILEKFQTNLSWATRVVLYWVSKNKRHSENSKGNKVHWSVHPSLSVRAASGVSVKRLLADTNFIY